MRIVEWTPRDAKRLADLWNASDAGWPSGLVRLRPKTVEEAREWERRQDCLGRFLAVEGRKAVGYCRVFSWWRSSDGTYVQWLNVDPKYQGRGVGKALLLKAIERSMDLGYDRVDLHTWPGNDKARPLYKRLGWMWVPRSHAYLQNYMPLILRHPAARPFFRKHDWYGSLQVDVERNFDEERVRGVDAFVYRFHSGRDRLEIAIDREARQVMAFEDRDLRVETWVPDGVAVEGAATEVRWAVHNKTRSEVRVRLRPRAPRSARVAGPRAFRVRPASVREVRGHLVVPRGFRDSPQEWASPAVATEVSVGARELRVWAGFRPKPALAFSWERPQVRVPSGGRAKATLVVRNQSGRSLHGVLSLASKALRVEPSRFRMQLGKGGVRRRKITLEAASFGNRVARVEASFRGSGLRIVKTLPAPCLAPGGRVAYAEGRDLVLESGQVRLVSRELGAITRIDLADGTPVIRYTGVAPGPPFWPSDLDWSLWKGSARMDDVPEIVRTSESRRRLGLVVEERWRLLTDRIVELRTSVENRGPRPWDLVLAWEVERALDHPLLTMPLRGGPVSEAFIENEWPDIRKDVPFDALLAGDWVHFGDGRAGYGIVWTGRRPSIEANVWTSPAWFHPSVRVPPGGKRTFDSVLFSVTRDWRETQALWAQVAGREPSNAEAKTGALRLEATPAVVLASPAAEVRVTLENPRRRPLTGRLRLAPGPGVAAPRKEWLVRRADVEHPWTAQARVVGRGARPSRLRFNLRSAQLPRVWEIPVIPSDGSGRVRIRGPPKQRSIANGALRLVASTTHGGALTSLSALGHEYLLSSYPTPGSHSWFRPFYGGVAPFAFAEDWPGELHRERFRLRAARRGTWTGVRLVADASGKDPPKGVRVAVDYLTRPGSDLVALALEVRNDTKGPLEIHAGFWVFLGLDGHPKCDVEFDRLIPRRWGRGGWSRWALADGGFAAFRAPGSPRAIVSVAAEPARLEVMDLRSDGRHGVISQDLDLAPGASATMLGCIALVRPDEAHAYRVLRGLTPGSFDATRAR